MMSPTEYVCLGLPPRASARGSGPAFSRPNRSLMRSVNGRRETKSRAVAFRATVAVSLLAPMRIRIFVLVAVVADVFELAAAALVPSAARSEEHTSELQSRRDLVCRLLLEKKKNKYSRRKYEKKNIKNKL